MYYWKNFDIQTVKKENRIILGSRKSGKWHKISEECHEILNMVLENKADRNAIKEIFEDIDDRDYFMDLLNLLEEKEIISYIDPNKKVAEKKINIITFTLTDRCNLSCIHCSVDAKEEAVKKELTTSEVKKAIDKLKNVPLDSLVFTGGEPMIRDDFFTIIAYARNNLDCELGLMTNGTYINNDNVDKLISCFSTIDLSLDGFDEESCSIIRGKGIFKKVIDSVELLQGKGFNEISLSMTLVEKNHDYLNAFLELNKELNTKPIPRHYLNTGRALENKNKLFTNINAIENISMEGSTLDDLEVSSCGAGITEFAISSDGFLFPCVLLWNNSYSLGNILDIDNLNDFLQLTSKNNSCNYSGCLKPLNLNKHEKCGECEVRIFCWSCLAYLEIYRNTEIFEQRCNYMHKKLSDLIWSN